MHMPNLSLSLPPFQPPSLSLSLSATLSLPTSFPLYPSFPQSLQYKYTQLTRPAFTPHYTSIAIQDADSAHTHTHPACLIFDVASFVTYAVLMIARTQKLHLFQDLLPFLWRK